MPSEQLKVFRQILCQIKPLWSSWRSIESWIAGFRPFLRRYFPADVPDFDRIAKAPQWLCLPRVGGPTGDQLARQAEEQELATNNQLTEDAQRKLLAFLDTLLQLTAEAVKPAEPITEAILYMPFRPYKEVRRPNIWDCGIPPSERPAQQDKPAAQEEKPAKESKPSRRTVETTPA
jgi:hypothetical protein